MNNLDRGTRRSAWPAAHAFPVRLLTAIVCVLGCPAIATAAIHYNGNVQYPGPAYPQGGWQSVGGLDTPTPFSVADTDAIATVPGSAEIEFYDSGQGSNGHVTFFSTIPDTPYDGTYAFTTPALTGSTTPGVRYENGQGDAGLVVPQGGWMGFFQTAPIIGYSATQPADHVDFDTSGTEPAGGGAFQASQQNNLDFQFATFAWYPATEIEVYREANNQTFVVFADDEIDLQNTHETRYPAQTIVGDPYESANLNLVGSDPTAFFTDCEGTPIANPVLNTDYGFDGYRFCVQGSNGSESVTISDASSASQLDPLTVPVKEIAPAAGAAPGRPRTGQPKVRGETVRFPVYCTAKTHCALSVRLEMIRTTKTTTKTAGRSSIVTRRSLVTVGAGSTSLKGHRQRTLSIALNATGRHALNAAGRLRLIASIRLTVNKTKQQSIQMVTVKRPHK